MFPIKLYTRRKIFKQFTGLSFFIFIWIWRHEQDEPQLVRHETIHFLQQAEMLFIFHWLFYVGFYLKARMQGKTWYAAYSSNPFEREAYANERNEKYLKTRKFFAWTEYMQ